MRKGRKESNTMVKTLIKRNEFVSVVIVILLVILLTVKGDVFWTHGNLDSLQAGIAPITIMAFGMMFLLICGYFDLSIGSTMLLAGILAGEFALDGLPISLNITLVLLAGLTLGCFNGFLVSILKINALIATIGTQFIGFGIAMILWDHVQNLTKFSSDFIKLGEGKIAGLYYMTWIMLVLLVVFTFFLKQTGAGRHFYFVGGNREASRLIGINDKRIIFISFVLSGFLAALGGLLTTARIQSPSQYTGGSVHMTCIIACIVGGGSFAGGKGSPLGALFGIMFMTLLTNMFNLLQMKTQFQNVIVGLILVTVVVMDGYLNLKNLREMGKA
jgi:ribose transport system permease protein